jgi:predicted phosphoribosyltransferase
MFRTESFRDRKDAARRLAGALAAYAETRPVVLAIPRGAVPMGAVVAEALGGELDVVLVRKIGLPGQPEFALGAVDESGVVVLPEESARFGVDARSLERLAQPELATIARRRAAWTPLRPPVNVEGRTVIVVDDGAATGSTMVAALDAVRRRGAARVVAAVPVASVEAAAWIRDHADDAVFLAVPEAFGAVGYYYDDFGEVTDADVAACLAARSTSGT